jgi:hypothetical protein
MSTSNGPTSTADRSTLRLRMAEHQGRQRLDGGWWPRSRDLAIELADLVDHFPSDRGRIMRAVYSPPDWDARPRRIPIARGTMKVGNFPRDDTHEMLLAMTDRTVLRLLVVPPGLSEAQGTEAMFAAAIPGNTHTASSVLETVMEHPDIDASDHWKDDGGGWWAPGTAAPSSRPRT